MYVILMYLSASALRYLLCLFQFVLLLLIIIKIHVLNGLTSFMLVKGSGALHFKSVLRIVLARQNNDFYKDS